MSEIVNQVGKTFGMATGLSGNQVQGYSIDGNAFNPNPQESDLTNALIQRSQGNAPSVAEMQMQQGLNQAQQQAMGTAAAQRGINPALAAHLAQQQQAGISQNAVQQTGMMRAQEQMANDQLLQQGLQSQRQGRQALQGLQVQNNLGTQGLQNQAYDAQADRGAGFFNSIGSMASMGGQSKAAHGGVIPGYAMGGEIAQDPGMLNTFATAIGQQVGQIMAGNQKAHPGLQLSAPKMNAPTGSAAGADGVPGTAVAGGAGDAGGLSALGPALMLAGNGGSVPGKAKVPGDSQTNDVQPAMLSPGEIVIPRTVAQMSPDKIAKFVIALRGA